MNMEYRRLGSSGLKVSAFSLGSWLTFGKLIKDETAERLMAMAYDAGVNFFDNAEIYARGNSEIVMGKILHKSGWPRDSYIVSSKVFFGTGKDYPTNKGLNRKHVVEACHAALKRLQVDYLDLYFCHRPDKETPIEETVWAMHHLIQQGKVLYWGTSEWTALEIMEAHMVARQYNLIPPVVEQPQYNMFERAKVEVEFSQLYKTVGLGTTIWSPLASGVLTGKYNEQFPEGTRLGVEGLEWLKERSVTEERIAKTKKLAALSGELGISTTQMALAWCLKNPNVSTVILGASKSGHLEHNLKAMNAVGLLDDKVMQQIEGILQNKPEKPMF
jgi:voltage-dependent potassium channel beta subunit